jgi:class 3 adenylate cyclase
MSVLTIIFTDVVESSAIKRDTSLGFDSTERDKAYLDAVQAPHYKLIRGCNKKHGGEEVCTIGDAFYLVFSNPVKAIRCAIDIQKLLVRRPIQTSRGPLKIRIGLHTGCPQRYEDGWQGTDVDTAARIEALAKGGQILLSATTYELVRNMSDVSIYSVGEHTLKGIGSVAVWGVLWDSKATLPLLTDEAANTREGRILQSLRRRLGDDFFMSGQRRGEFGRTRIPNESHLYHEQVRESLKHKAYYYLTYWGWEIMPKLRPDLVKDRAKITSAALKARFGGKRWVEVDLEVFDIVPTIVSKRVVTIRHTAKSAEILLLINEPAIPSQVAWDLINNAPSLMNSDGGWREFKLQTARSKLWASVNVFRFLSKVRSGKYAPNVPGELDRFRKKATPLLRKTESYLDSHWHRQKWKFGDAPSRVNAPLVLIDYLPFSRNDALVDSVYESLHRRVTPAGRLHPKYGLHNSTSEYVLSIRIAYALMLTDSRKDRTGVRANKLFNWVLDNYSADHTLDTCDMAFLSEMISMKLGL